MIGLNHQPLPDASREDDIMINLAYSLSADKAGLPASGKPACIGQVRLHRSGMWPVKNK